MRKMIFAINMTLDGNFDHTAVIADDELHEKASELFKSVDVVLYGRVMYELMEYWKSALSDNSLSPSVKEFAETINKIDKIVFTKTLQKVSWNTKIMREVDPEEIRAMKQLSGRDILLGGGSKLALSLMRYDLIDEYRLIIQPIILGKGKRLFEGIEKHTDLQLIGENVRKSGAMELIYRPSQKVS